jgi:hypothetical protein
MRASSPFYLIWKGFWQKVGAVLASASILAIVTGIGLLVKEVIHLEAPSKPQGNGAWTIPLLLFLSGVFLLAIAYFLSRSREKAPRATADPEFSKQERAILYACKDKGRAWILTTDVHGPWVRAGKTDFFDAADPAVQAQYLAAFYILIRRNYFQEVAHDYFVLAGPGFEKARQITKPAADN